MPFHHLFAKSKNGIRPNMETKHGQIWKRNTAKYRNKTQPNVETAKIIVPLYADSK